MPALLDALLERLEISAAVVVGHSMGGFVSAELAINCPQRVDRLVLVCPAGLSTYADRRDLRLVAQMRRFKRIVNAYHAQVSAHAEPSPGTRACASRPSTHVVAHHSDRLPAPLVAEQIRGAGKPGYIEGMAGEPPLRLPRPAERDRLPDPDRVGRA